MGSVIVLKPVQLVVGMYRLKRYKGPMKLKCVFIRTMFDNMRDVVNERSCGMGVRNDRAVGETKRAGVCSNVGV